MHMFYDTPVFNNNVSTFNTKNVINMQQMFTSALVFNSDISKWDTSRVQTMAMSKSLFLLFLLSYACHCF
jgi:surface protein